MRLPKEQQEGHGPNKYQSCVGPHSIPPNHAPSQYYEYQEHQLAKQLVVSPLRVNRPESMRAWAFHAEVDRLEGRLAEDEIQEGGVVSLDNKEEDLFKRDVEKLWSNDDMAWIAPYAVADQVRVPRYG